VAQREVWVHPRLLAEHSLAVVGDDDAVKVLAVPAGRYGSRWGPGGSAGQSTAASSRALI
jgi:hypothetical protein